MLTAEQKTAVQGVLDAIFDLKGSPRSRTLATPFMELPDREAWKEYYLVIPHPRCLNLIQESLEKGSYNTPLAVYEDISLVFANALHFNEEGSSISKDARTLKAHFETTWATDPLLQLLPPIKRDVTPPPKPAPSAMDDVDMSPTGGDRSAGGNDTNWENMRPRDKQGDDIIRKVEAQLPKWKGPSGQEGWVTLEGKQANDPYAWYAEVLNRLKSFKDNDGDGLSSEALSRIDENAALPECSFATPMSLALIENRVVLKGYPAPKDFDMDMMRLFEKGRRWFEPGSKDYGRVLVLQRLYQGLTSSTTARNLLSSTSSAHFSSVPAGPGFAKPLHHAQDSGPGVTTYRIQNKDRTFIRNVWFKGVEYRMGDYVHLVHPNTPDRPIIAQVFKCYIPDSGPQSHYVTVCWYFRPEQTYHAASRAFWENEVFKTGHFADHAVEDLIERVGCQFMTRHIRGRPKPPNWYVNWPLYVCDSRYNDRDRIFVRIKNWASCIPDELRKGSGEGFYPIVTFEKTVMPRKVDSPFVGKNALVNGPGGLMEEDEGRRKSKRNVAPKAGNELGGTPAPMDVSAGDVNIFAPIPPLPITSKGNKAGSANDRSLIVAAGGRSALGADPTIETLPEDTARRFDRDPRTNEVLWFSGPPIDRMNPDAFKPKYSLAYLAYLAKQKAAAEGDEDMDDDEDEDEEGEGSRSRKRRRKVSEEQAESPKKSEWVAPPTLMSLVFKDS